jgi:hypothetical protein
MKASVQANYTRIIMAMEIKLSPRRVGGANVTPTASGWRLDIPAGPRRSYRLAQLDDYARTPRTRLDHVPPWTLRLRARVSATALPGTWGFGLWNDPFGLSLGFGGKPGRLPALPQTVWFFHASLPNWLCLSDGSRPGSDQPIPANGFFAGTFRSPRIPSFLFAPALLGLPLFELRPTSRILRRWASQLARQDGAGIEADVTQWHEYSIQWLEEGCMFSVDGDEVLFTSISPRPPLGLAIWIDNQFAAWTPQGRLGYGTLENPAAWLEVERLDLQFESASAP